MNKELMFSHKSDDWSTPTGFYNKLDEEFHFDFDPCPIRSEVDGLDIEWNGNIFVNPPYSNIKSFIIKGIEELKKGNAKVVVFLVPARTDTKWFHEFIYNKNKKDVEIRFLKGRLKFGQSKNSAPFPSMLIIMNPFPL